MHPGREMSDKMYCKRCGFKVNDNDSFCRNCGAVINYISDSSQPETKPIQDVGDAGYDSLIYKNLDDKKEEPIQEDAGVKKYAFLK